MLVAIVILLLFIASALLGAMYSHFTAFMVNFRDIQQYNKAYYSALAGLERAQLVLRHRSPGYEGSGGRIGDTSYGMFASGDRRPMGDFSFLSATGEEGGVFWEIRSRTTQIPRSWEGTIDWMLASGNRLDFNRLDYAEAENITFMLDSGDALPYLPGTLLKSQSVSFTGKLQLPSLLKEGQATPGTSCIWGYCFGPLDTTLQKSLGWGVQYDDPVVDWSFRKEGTDGHAFQVMSTMHTGDYHQDSRFLEERINQGKVFDFWVTSSPFSSAIWETIASPSARLTGIVENPQDLSLFTHTFKDVLSTATGVLFRLSLINPLRSQRGYLFPYLEYQLSFPHEVSDRYYSIFAKGKNGNYEVELFMQKPTITESILKTFTVIF